MRIHCLHTSEAHVPTFRRLFHAAAPGAEMGETVRADWLAAARAGGLTQSLRRNVAAHLMCAAGRYDAVLCTCSTLGQIADDVAASHTNVVRIDAPLMRRAVQNDGQVLVALCLESTRAATEALLGAAYSNTGMQPNYRVVLCASAWPHFERGDARSFAQEIVQAVGQDVAVHGPVSCIVLAQASMASVEPQLARLNIPVYSSPRLAVAEAVRVAALSQSRV